MANRVTKVLATPGEQVIVQKGSASVPSIVFANPNAYGNLDDGLYGVDGGGFGATAGGTPVFTADDTYIKFFQGMMWFGANGTIWSSIGLSAALGIVPVRATTDTTAVGNVGAGEDTLISYSLPAATLGIAGRGVRITAWGTTANNGNAKTLKCYFGTQVILTHALTTSIAGVWKITAEVFSTGTDAQDWVSQLVTTGTAGAAVNDVEVGTATQDDGAAITIKCTGEATSNDDIVQEGLLVEALN